MTPTYLPPTVDDVPESIDENTSTEKSSRNEEVEDMRAHIGRKSLPPPSSDTPNSAASDEVHDFRRRSRSDTARRASSNPPNSSSPPYVPNIEGDTVVKKLEDNDAPGIEDEDADSEATEREVDYTTIRALSPSTISTLTSFTSSTMKTNGSGSSSGSGSTITEVSFRRKSLDKDKRRATVPERHRRRSHSPKKDEKVDVMSFLEPDSPALTPEIIQQSVEHASRWKSSGDSPSAKSTSSSTSSFQSDVFSEPAGDPDTDRSSSPEHSIDGDSPGEATASKLAEQLAASHQQRQAHRYGTPEMPRGKAILPHIPPRSLQPRIPGTHQHIKHLPRAEKLPLTGYELLASRLSTGSPGGPSIKPIYRRFETLNHRLLLHLQDELAELEEQLHRLDTADTQTRRLQSCILPASRRNDFLAGGELQWHKTDILGKIGFKLGQYNHVLSSFKETQELHGPSLSDIHDYRTYLSTQQPITEIETRFLDPADDLVSLARPSFDASADDEARTPMPGMTTAEAAFPPGSPTSEASTASKVVPPAAAAATDHYSEITLPHFAVGMAVAVLIPILTFSVIPGLVGRMTVVLLVGFGVLGGLTQAQMVKSAPGGSVVDGRRDWLICIGIYGGVMAVIATLFG